MGGFFTGCIDHEPTYDRDSCGACHLSPFGDLRLSFTMHNDPDLTQMEHFHDAHLQLMSLTNPLDCYVCHVMPKRTDGIYVHVDGEATINVEGNPWITAWNPQDHSCQSACHGNVWMVASRRALDYTNQLDCIICHTGDKFALHTEGMPKEYCYHCHPTTMNADGTIKLGEHILDLKRDENGRLARDENGQIIGLDVDVLTGNALCSACHALLPDSHRTAVARVIGGAYQGDRLQLTSKLLNCTGCHPEVGNVFDEPHALHFPTVDNNGQIVKGETAVNLLPKGLICTHCHGYIPETGAHNIHVLGEVQELINFIEGFAGDTSVAYNIEGKLRYSCPTCHRGEPSVEAVGTDNGLFEHIFREHVVLRGLAGIMSMGRMPTFDFSTLTCINVWCHHVAPGAQYPNPSWYDQFIHRGCERKEDACIRFNSSCVICHGAPPPSTEGNYHPGLRFSFPCITCHPDATDATPPPEEEGEIVIDEPHVIPVNVFDEEEEEEE